MAREGLFEDLPEMSAPKVAESGGRPRLREPVRDQIELRAVDLDSIIGADHPVRLIWAYVERLDLSALEARIKAREGHPGHPPIAPRLLLALWLYATSEGVGSGRALERLCESHDAYRWLAGGVSVNYHTLSDFRVAHPELLDELLSENVAALAAAGLIDLDTLAQDGIRVRAAAGAGSFRRRVTVEKHLKRARRVVARLSRELDDDPDASNRRIKAALERAALERAARLAAALDRLAAIEEEKKRRAKTNPKETAKEGEKRVSTTDPEARVIKMPDGGFRPGWNMQIASAVEQQVIVAVDVTASGSDRGLVRPMLEAIGRRFGRLPRRHLADGGFTKGADIEWTASEGVALHCPPTRSKHKTDPFAPRPQDGPGVAAWRRRMSSPAGKARYKRRSIGECINARGRRWTLDQITVRGRDKALSVLRWFALANNILQGHRLVRLAAAA
jgi:transposase